MKKQILFLAMFTLALIFAGTTTAWGQLLPGVTATTPIVPLTCVAGSYPLHPYPGQSYTYMMDGTTGPEDVIGWTWFATKDQSFISVVAGIPVLNTAGALAVTPGELLAAGTNYGVAGSAIPSVDITWSPEILAGTQYQGTGAPGTPTFVVGYGKGTNCADNIQVFEINPVFNFQIDIANIDPVTDATLAWDAPTNQCVDPVQSAVYNTTSKELDMDYGKDTLYFEVAAANFVNDFTPQFRLISGLVGVQTAEVGVATSLANATAGTFITGLTTNWTIADVGADWAPGVALTAATPSDAIAGVSAYVRVIISNLTEESLADNVFSLAVDARDNANAGIWDMEDDDCPVPGTGLDQADQVDLAEHTINPRPTIIMDVTMPDAAPAPDDIIIKTP